MKWWRKKINKTPLMVPKLVLDRDRKIKHSNKNLQTLEWILNPISKNRHKKITEKFSKDNKNHLKDFNNLLKKILRRSQSKKMMMFLMTWYQNLKKFVKLNLKCKNWNKRKNKEWKLWTIKIWIKDRFKLTSLNNKKIRNQNNISKNL